MTIPNQAVLHQTNKLDLPWEFQAQRKKLRPK